ncbi:MAG: osmotically inducible protein OsmC [Candidatus Melainabacteria bacterium RIFCSPHIGHO2_02_FULL_34_12]|nr:MAG: osmotically inducible protein OsmC [Candidatus Melainabacteria bacterium RIFCSPHIGHO2_02_FULL_34_12]
MAVEIKGEYEGDLRVKSVHGPSGSVLETDAPLDNQGKGEKFSPTDLVVTSLASCMITIMGIVARRDGIKLEGVTFRAEKHMIENPRRIGKIILEIKMPAGLSDDQKKKLEKFAHTCPVHQSLHPDIKQEIKFIYP